MGGEISLLHFLVHRHVTFFYSMEHEKQAVLMPREESAVPPASSVK